MTDDKTNPRPDDPVDLDELTPAFDDADGLRRSVRRAIGRTAVDAAALALIILVIGALVSVLVLQPLVLNRGDRAATAARAAYEAPMIFNPGVEVSRFRIDSGLWVRETTVEVGVPLGTGVERLDQVVSEIGMFSLDLPRIVGSPSVLVPMSDVLGGLDPGTVTTVSFSVPTPLSIEDAQRLADDPGADVRLTWAGFDAVSSELGQPGYPLCRTMETPDRDLFAATSASAGGTLMSGPPSVERALSSVRAALDAIAADSSVATALAGGASGAVESLAQALEGEVAVTSFVVTGPTPEVVAFLDDLGVSDGLVLAVGFYSWGSPICGR
ncbi:MAG: hypothetical protein R3246_10450 [Acidimicrobiia bacterium]|nr:hypothetical protein [Acidimicrobiia bacterium]